MTKKALKRKNSETAEEPAEKKKLEVEYQAGGLSSLFGKSTDESVVESNVIEGESIIEKPKKENKEEGEKSDRKAQRENRKKKKKLAAEERDEVNARTLFVGNMPLTMNEKKVAKMFASHGEVESVRMRSLIPSSEKVSKRITHLTGKFNENQNCLTFYVVFKKKEDAEKALNMNGESVEEHVIRVDRCGKKKDFNKHLTVFVGGLEPKTTDDQLIKLFGEQVGPVEFVRIVRDKETGLAKGFAFVHFKDESSVSLALGMDTIKMDKRTLRITKVMKKQQIAKVDAAKKKTNSLKMKAKQNEIKGKLENYKFSTKKQRSDEQNERRAMKKSMRKAINKKKNVTKKRLMN